MLLVSEPCNLQNWFKEWLSGHESFFNDCFVCDNKNGTCLDVSYVSHIKSKKFPMPNGHSRLQKRRYPEVNAVAEEMSIPVSLQNFQPSVSVIRFSIPKETRRQQSYAAFITQALASSDGFFRILMTRKN